MRSEEQLCPTNMRFVPNKSNVRIDLDETQDEPLFEISLEILKHKTIYNAITLTMEVPKIYMQQFLYTASKNEKSKKYYFVLDYQRFEIRAELFRHALQISPRQPNKQVFPPPVQYELVIIPLENIDVGAVRHGNWTSKRMKLCCQVISTA
ncbi:hypothetical protein Tco_0271097 [Tanacetum coccineum]